MTHYIICDNLAQGRKAEADYRDGKSDDVEVRLLSPGSIRSFEGTRLFPGDTFQETILDLAGGTTVWDAMIRQAHRSHLKIRSRMGLWHALPTADHPISKLDPLLDDVRSERIEQLRKWGDQHHEFRRHDGDPNFDFGHMYAAQEERYKRQFERQTATLDGGPTWDVILLEEVYEALAEDDPALRIQELIQVAAVALAMAQDLESKQK